MVKLFAAVLVTAVVMIVVFQFIDPKVEKAGGNASTTLVDNSNTTSGTLSCSISGEVKRSGTYVLEENTTLEQLISVAGGLFIRRQSQFLYCAKILPFRRLFNGTNCQG